MDELEEAKNLMFQAGKQLMQTNPPRDLNRAWRSVAMRYSEEFVTQNYSALSTAFNRGMTNTD